jgi:excisionase family DNA binding protein
VNGYIEPGQRYELRPGGWIRFSPEDWGALSGWMERHLTADFKRNGARPEPANAACHIFAKMATGEIAFDPSASLCPPADIDPRLYVNMSNVIMPVLSKDPITVKEAAERHGCSERHMRRLCAAGRISAKRHGGDNWLIDPDQFPEPESDAG